MITLKTYFHYGVILLVFMAGSLTGECAAELRGLKPKVSSSSKLPAQPVPCSDGTNFKQFVCALNSEVRAICDRVAQNETQRALCKWQHATPGGSERNKDLVSKIVATREGLEFLAMTFWNSADQNLSAAVQQEIINSCGTAKTATEVFHGRLEFPITGYGLCVSSFLGSQRATAENQAKLERCKTNGGWGECGRALILGAMGTSEERQIGAVGLLRLCKEIGGEPCIVLIQGKNYGGMSAEDRAEIYWRACLYSKGKFGCTSELVGHVPGSVVEKYGLLAADLGDDDAIKILESKLQEKGPDDFNWGSRAESYVARCEADSRFCIFANLVVAKLKSGKNRDELMHRVEAAFESMCKKEAKCNPFKELFAQSSSRQQQAKRDCDAGVFQACFKNTQEIKSATVDVEKVLKICAKNEGVHKADCLRWLKVQTSNTVERKNEDLCFAAVDSSYYCSQIVGRMKTDQKLVKDLEIRCDSSGVAGACYVIGMLRWPEGKDRAERYFRRACSLGFPDSKVCERWVVMAAGLKLESELSKFFGIHCEGSALSRIQVCSDKGVWLYISSGNTKYIADNQERCQRDLKEIRARDTGDDPGFGFCGSLMAAYRQAGDYEKWLGIMDQYCVGVPAAVHSECDTGYEPGVWGHPLVSDM